MKKAIDINQVDDILLGNLISCILRNADVLDLPSVVMAQKIKIVKSELNFENKDYKIIRSRIKYFSLLKSGMFFEFYPGLTGDWEQDKNIIEGV